MRATQAAFHRVLRDKGRGNAFRGGRAGSPEQRTTVVPMRADPQVRVEPGERYPRDFPRPYDLEYRDRFTSALALESCVIN